MELVLLHGALGASEDFDRFGISTATTFDFIGHGRYAGQPFTMDDLADQLIQVVEGLPSPVNVFGFSMGGYAAILAASLRPELFESIHTLGTKFKWTEEESQKEIRHLNPEIILEKVPQYAEYLKQLHGIAWKEVLENTADMMMDLGRSPRITKTAAGSLECTVNIFRGDGDKMVTEEESRETASWIKNGNYSELEGTKHPLGTIKKEQFIELLPL